MKKCELHNLIENSCIQVRLAIRALGTLITRYIELSTSKCAIAFVVLFQIHATFEMLIHTSSLFLQSVLTIKYSQQQVVGVNMFLLALMLRGRRTKIAVPLTRME